MAALNSHQSLGFLFFLGILFFFFVAPATLADTSSLNAYERAQGIKYNPIEGIVRVDGNHTLSDLATLPPDVFEIKEDTCFIKKPIYLESSDTLFFTNDTCSLINLYPDVRLRVAGKVYFENVKVQSYDPATGRPIELTESTYYLRRPYIDTKPESEFFSAINSEFSHLGYYSDDLVGSRWGVALYYVENGFIDNSDFHDNYFGLYFFTVVNLTIKDSRIHNNLEYGLDFHDFSNDILVINNEVYENGNHGIIFSIFCENNKIIGNYVYNHTDHAFVKGKKQTYGAHGIMLHMQSNNNLIEDNLLVANRVGISLLESNNNRVAHNLILDDLETGISISESANNFIFNNTVINAQEESFVSSSSKNNTYQMNSFYNTSVFKGKDYRIIVPPTVPDTYTSQENSPETNLSTTPVMTPSSEEQQASSLGGVVTRLTTSKIFVVGILTAIALLFFIFEVLYSFKQHKKQEEEKTHGI